jgi:hypothetical protein
MNISANEACEIAKNASREYVDVLHHWNNIIFQFLQLSNGQHPNKNTPTAIIYNNIINMSEWCGGEHVVRAPSQDYVAGRQEPLAMLGNLSNRRKPWSSEIGGFATGW